MPTELKPHDGSSADDRKSVSPALIIGILLLPVVFVWFLIRPGNSSVARWVGFGWLGLSGLLFLAVGQPPDASLPSAQRAPASTEAPAPAALVSDVHNVRGRKVRLPGEPTCALTSETADWEYIKANAVRTADAYAVRHNPLAAFVGADGDVFYQVDGPYKGQYTLIISNDQIALAQLVPLFDFCTPASELDDQGNLWKVVKAKLNGREF